MARWFRRKRWGYGWTPCTWQGWLMTAVFTAAVVATATQARSLGPQRTGEIIVALTLVLLAVTLFTSGKDSDA